MRKTKLIVKTKSKKYPIIFGSNIVREIQSLLNSNNMSFEKCFIITDTNVPRKQLNILERKIKCKKKIIYHFKASEKNKSLKSINSILNKLFIFNFSRNDCIISFGGGITGDVAAFAASIYKRGLKFINIPTTLLAQVDSSIGGKSGINNKYGKNLIGSFIQPDLVISDINLLKSLPKREIICGYGEILKHSIISKRNTFNYLKRNFNKILNLKSPFINKAIIDSCKIKRNIVQLDEREKNLRKILNLGHTFAHAYESALSYSKKLNHGEAVILGIMSSAKFSFENNILNKKDYKLIINHINLLDLQVNLNKYFRKKNISSIIKYMKSDKKNNSSLINLILIKEIGKVLLELRYNQSKIKRFFEKDLIN